MPKSTTLERIQAAWPTVYKVASWESPVHVADLIGSTLVLHVRTYSRAKSIEADPSRVLDAVSKAAGRPIKRVVCELSPLLSEQERRGEESRRRCPIGRTDVRRLLGAYHDMLGKLKASGHAASILLRFSERLANLAERALGEERQNGLNPGASKAAEQMAAMLIDLVAASESTKAKKTGRRVA